MQVVKQSQYGDSIHSVRYTCYMSSLEYNDLRTLLNLILLPSPIAEEEDLRVKALGLVDSNLQRRLCRVVSEFNMEL